MYTDIHPMINQLLTSQAGHTELHHPEGRGWGEVSIHLYEETLVIVHIATLRGKSAYGNG